MFSKRLISLVVIFVCLAAKTDGTTWQLCAPPATEGSSPLCTTIDLQNSCNATVSIGFEGQQPFASQPVSVSQLTSSTGFCLRPTAVASLFCESVCVTLDVDSANNNNNNSNSQSPIACANLDYSHCAAIPLPPNSIPQQCVEAAELGVECDDAQDPSSTSSSDDDGDDDECATNHCFSRGHCSPMLVGEHDADRWCQCNTGFGGLSCSVDCSSNAWANSTIVMSNRTEAAMTVAIANDNLWITQVILPRVVGAFSTNDARVRVSIGHLSAEVSAPLVDLYAMRQCPPTRATYDNRLVRQSATPLHMNDRCPARSPSSDENGDMPWFVGVGCTMPNDCTDTDTELTFRMAPLYSLPLEMVVDVAEGGEGGVGMRLGPRDDAYFTWSLPYPSAMRVRVIATTPLGDRDVNPLSRVSLVNSPLCPLSVASDATFRSVVAADAERTHDVAERTQTAVFSINADAGLANVAWTLHVESARAVTKSYAVRLIIDGLEPQCIHSCVAGQGRCGIDGLCRCTLDYSGNDCSLPQCMPPCGLHGQCTAPNQCSCEPRWTGPYCIDFVHVDDLGDESSDDSSLPGWAIALISIVGVLAGCVLGAMTLHYWRRYQARRHRYEVLTPAAMSDILFASDENDNHHFDDDSSSDDSEF